MHSAAIATSLRFDAFQLSSRLLHSARYLLFLKSSIRAGAFHVLGLRPVLLCVGCCRVALLSVQSQT